MNANRIAGLGLGRPVELLILCGWMKLGLFGSRGWWGSRGVSTRQAESLLHLGWRLWIAARGGSGRCYLGKRPLPCGRGSDAVGVSGLGDPSLAFRAQLRAGRVRWGVRGGWGKRATGKPARLGLKLLKPRLPGDNPEHSWFADDSYPVPTC